MVSVEEESMPDSDRRTEGIDFGSLGQRTFSRRDVLRGGLVAGGAAFLAACGAQATQAPSTAPATGPAATTPPAPTPTPENYAGVSLHNFTGGYMIPWLDAGTAKWKAETGGDAMEDNVTFAEKQVKQAGVIATQDSSYDMMYTTAAYGYIPKFGKRLLLPVDTAKFGDMTDFFDGSLAALTTDDGTLRAW